MWESAEVKGKGTLWTLMVHTNPSFPNAFKIWGTNKSKLKSSWSLVHCKLQLWVVLFVILLWYWSLAFVLWWWPSRRSLCRSLTSSKAVSTVTLVAVASRPKPPLPFLVCIYIFILQRLFKFFPLKNNEEISFLLDTWATENASSWE